MKKFIKLYWPISISILFMFIIGILIGTTFYGDALFEYDLIGLSLVLYTLILVIVIYAEMIYFMVKACKCNEIKNKVLWCLSLYLFNVFVFPYFNLKYICKNKNNKISMIVFILLIIASIILGINITCNVEKKYVNKYITIEEDDVLIKFSGNYRETKIGDYDFYIKDSKRQINIGGFIYDEDDNTTPSKILSERKSWIKFYRSPSQFLETFKEETDDSIITTDIYVGTYEGEQNIYYISTIEFKDTNCFVNTISIHLYEKDNDYKTEIYKILNDMKYEKEL